MFPQLTPMVRNLLMINVAFFIGSMMIVGIQEMGTLYGFYSDEFKPFQFLSYMFLHDGFRHILMNMLGLVMLGTVVERFLGDKKFIILYMSSGLFAGVLYNIVDYIQMAPVLDAIDLAASDFSIPHFSKAFELMNKKGWLNYQQQSSFSAWILNGKMTEDQISTCIAFLNNSNVQITSKSGGMVGASGAVYGVLISAGMYFPNMQIQLLIPPIPIKVKHLSMFLGITAIYFTFTASGDRVAHLAHLAGMLPAIALYFFWKKDKNSFY